MYFSLIIFIFASSSVFVSANDVLGCGGFIKSHVPIDFSKVEIKLYTKQGILKDRTNCAPNNGYYFIPLYDKGDYVLQLEPPPGWSFTPTKINLSIDGKSDDCSQGKDVNFVFKGFGITGKVEIFGTDGKGPAGVPVELKSDSEVRTSVTTENGNFFFTPVYPGRYTVSISHPRWNIKKKSVAVTVTEGNTDLPSKSLMIGGFDVTGVVKSGKDPVEGASLILFKSGDDKSVVNVEDCDKTPVPGFKSKDKFICHVTSNSAGKFVFPTVSTGTYYIVPFYKSNNIYFHPGAFEFTVKDGTVQLSEAFEISGFTISGRVLSSQQGKPLEGAVVFVDDQEVARTKKDGSFTLEGIKTGNYVLHVKADDMEFDKTEIKINLNTLKLSDIFPTSYKVCGEVVSDKPQVVKITKLGTKEEIEVTVVADNAFFCQYLTLGKYQIQVLVDEEDASKGVQFFPISQTVDVTKGPITGVTFSQLKAELSGQVKCIKQKDCENVKVVLRQITNDIIQPDKDISSDLHNGFYVFDDVRPGTYEVFLTTNRFCWEKAKQTVVVTNATLTIPPFVQSGFSVVFISSHDTQVSYKQIETRENSQSTKEQKKITTLNINKDKSTHCVPKPGQYTFNLEGCHTYNPATISYNTDSSENEIYLVAQKHKHTIKIQGVKDSKDLFVTVNMDGKITKEGPLAYKNDAYILEMFLMPNENAILTPQSEILYFDPPVVTVTGKNDCADLGQKFQAVKGKVFKGKVIPPLAGVQITVETEGVEALIDQTDAQGKYQFPPLDGSKNYKISAIKDSYVLVGPNDNGDFVAHKLAEIVVEVLDEVQNVPLQGALLSLSGGESYRSNLQTNEFGKITFHSLSPSEYFLRPVLKEYNFEPNSKIINVKEGATVHVQLKGKRVAYSAFGQVTSLNREPEEKMIVIANGRGNCSEYSEEATSEASGNFRIRGLIPYCSYDLAIKGAVDDDEIIERAAPPIIRIESLNEDIKNLHFIVFRAMPNTDVIVKVHAPVIEHYKTLYVKIHRESPPSGLIHSIKLDVSSIKITEDYNTGVLVQVPTIPLDGKSYSVQLESTIAQHKVVKPTIQYFTANSSFKYVELQFVVKTNQAEQQIKQTSIWTLLAIFTGLVVIYNTDFVVQFVRDKLNSFNGNAVYRNKSPVRDYAVDAAEIDQIVESINVNKRKVKPRKI